MKNKFVRYYTLGATILLSVSGILFIMFSIAEGAMAYGFIGGSLPDGRIWKLFQLIF